MEKTAVVIPAYEPDQHLVSFVSSLYEAGFRRIVVVDDGSGFDYLTVFKELEDYACVIHHDRNMGKGAALKTGFSTVLMRYPDSSGIVTADSDGQHTVQDCQNLAGRLEEDEEQLIIGSRNFSLPGIPLRSKFGNRTTSAVFRLLFGTYLPDTQSGLRAFSFSLIPFMLTVSGSRYEYETNVLSACVRRRIPVIPVPIETIYEDSNKGSHFRPIGDSIRIYVVMLGSFFRFIASSLICTVVDHLLFNLLNLACFSNGTTKEARYIFLSTAAARLFSASLNYVLNRRFVFESRGSIKRSALSYIALCGLIMLLSYLGTWGLSIVGLNSTVSKIISDTALFLVAYVIQERLVFSNSRR